MSVSPMCRMGLNYASFQGDRMNDTEVKLLHTMVPNDRVSLKEAGMWGTIIKTFVSDG